MSGFGAYYKGDVSEVTIGHETGLFVEHGIPRTWRATDNTLRYNSVVQLASVTLVFLKTHCQFSKYRSVC
jgi:hypothetical protein